MKSFRMSIPASVCISFECETEEEAVRLAEKVVDDNDDGVTIDLCYFMDLNLDPDERLYLTKDGVGVEDIEEVEE